MRADATGGRAAPGCLGALLGVKTSHEIYFVITFRRQGKLRARHIVGTTPGTSRPTSGPGCCQVPGAT
jgi:hypothetical protein